jgi:hypothetical protein
VSDDLDIMQTVGSTTQLDFSAQGATVSGEQKVAQEFVNFFLTQLGTVRGLATYGTDFVFDASIGAIRTESDIVLQFGQASSLFREFISSRLEGTESDDEVFDKAELLSFVQEEGKLTLRVRVTTEAGGTEEVEIPVISVEI